MSMIELTQQNKRMVGVGAIIIAALYAVKPIREIISPVADFQFLAGNELLTPITVVAVVAVIAAIMAKDRNL